MENKQPAAGQTSEADLIEARRSKAAAVRSRGENPFANDVDATSRLMISQVRQLVAAAQLEAPESDGAKYDPGQVESLAGQRSIHVVGRLMLRRGFGKVSFLK